jgi:TatD DNase family protein
MELFDTHSHLDDEQLLPQVEDVIGRATDAGVRTMIAVGTTAASSAECVRLAERFDGVFAAVGIQPNYGAEATESEWDQIEQLSQHARVVAIGETGLDAYWDFTPFDEQERLFAQHIDLAQRRNLPFIVHMRDCGPQVIQTLKAAGKAGPLQGVMHSFTGNASLAEQCLDVGLYISFAGMITFKKSHELRNVAQGIPLDRLLIETDSPYLSPHPKRGHRPNEPSLIVHTATCLAQVREIALEELAHITTTNARRLFSRCTPR